MGRVPGLLVDNLDIAISGDSLTIRGRFDSDIERQESREWRWYSSELSYGPFERTLTLPTQVQSDKVEAQASNGVLRLTPPRAEEAKPKTIKVRVG